MAERLITLAIHTLRYACSLKELLEKEGVSATLQNVNLENPQLSAGIRVRIKESDLPVALRIIENPEIFSDEFKDEEDIPHVLLPTDFSTHSIKATKLAFQFASNHCATIRLLHSFVDPIYSKRSQLNDNLNFDNDSVHDKETERELSEAEVSMNRYESGIVARIKSGEIPPVKFRHIISEGVPEDVINQYARQHHPMLIVMGTRDAGAKARELVGSVTAEVLDTCRFPIMTIPQSVKLDSVNDINNILFFSNFDQQDILAIDTLFRLLPQKALKIHLVKLPSKKFTGDTQAPLEKLRSYCQAHYPINEFVIDNLSLDEAETDFDRVMKEGDIDLIAVPNKKKNVFARFFNPGVAHRLLFQADTPMMVIPI